MNNIDFITNEPAEEYHARSKSGEWMSSHLLADFRESPALYRRKTAGEFAEPESLAFAVGRAAHCLILEGGRAFDRRYTVTNGPVNPKTGEPFGRQSRVYCDWAAKQEREIISGREFEFIRKLETAVRLHPLADELLTDGIAEGVVRVEYCSVPCQIRMDWFSPRHGIVDLKTCDSLGRFEFDVRRYGYLFQLAFYRAVVREAAGDIVPVHIVAVEKNEPFSAGVWKLTADVLDRAEAINAAALNRFRFCRESGVWPTGYEDLRLIDDL